VRPDFKKKLRDQEIIRTCSREAFTIASEEEEEDRMAYFWGRTFCVGNSKK
jgi:hypothetical protein